MKFDIFISYSRKDAEAVSAIDSFLKERGYTVWFDKAEIKPADLWSDEIVKAIENCKIFIVILTPHSSDSADVAKEVSQAAEDKKAILPISLTPSFEKPTGGIRFHLAGIHRLIVDPPHGLDELEERIAEMISHPGEFSIELTSITGVLPKTSAGSFPIQPTVIAILDTLLREVPRHLVEQLTAAQNRYYISLSEAEHIENALRR